MSAQHRSMYSLPPPLGSTPWFVLPHRRRKQIQTFFNPMDDSIHHRSIPEMHGKMCFGSSHGWLMMVDRYSEEFFLLNITSMEVISPPPLSIPLTPFIYFTLSSSSNVPGCMIVLVFDKSPFIMLCPLHGKEWTMQEIDLDQDDDENRLDGAIMSCNGELFLCTTGEKLFVLNFASGVIHVQNMEVERMKILSGVPFKRQLVFFGDEIFAVILYYKRYGGFVINVEVFKLDLHKLVWERIECIGEDRAIFWGDSGALCMVTKTRIKGNCIYFLQSCCDGMRRCRFRLNERTISYKIVCSNLCKLVQSPYLATTPI